MEAEVGRMKAGRRGEAEPGREPARELGRDEAGRDEAGKEEAGKEEAGRDGTCE